jgi:N-methylhydantoinase B
MNTVPSARVREPILLEIVRNALTTIAQEMSASVLRSAFSTFIKEGGDASAAILLASGELVAQPPGTSLIHLCSLRESLRGLLAAVPAAAMRDGDVYAMNEPAKGGVHSNDIAVFRPVFVDGRPEFMTAALIHVADLGGVTAGGLPSQATEIFHEGLVLPPVALYEASAPNDHVIRIIEANSRAPEKVMGDIRALVAGCNVGAARLGALIDRHGMSVLRDVVEELFDYTERRTRAGIAELPPIDASGEFRIDDDGIDPDRGYTVRVRLRREGTDFVADFTGSDPQAAGPINAAYSQAMTGAVFGARCFLDATIPVNEGAFRPIKSILPPGTIVHPSPTAAVNARLVTVMAIVEAMLEALAKHTPGRAIAASALLHLWTLTGRAAGAERPWIMMDLEYGGAGGRSGKDGVDAIGIGLMAGRSAATQIEVLEAEYPVVFERQVLRRDSGGHGAWRGGAGVERTLKVLTDTEVSVRADRMRLPPPGRLGGMAGKPGAWIVNAGTDRERRLNTKQMGVRIAAGDTLTMLTSGGGGFGAPMDRDPALVREDVVSGRLSIADAAEIYGVELGEGLVIDEAATRQRRSRHGSRASDGAAS